MSNLKEVFGRLRDAGLKLKLNKCKFCNPGTIYLGHYIGENGVSPDPSKISAIDKIDIDTWKDVSYVKTFLGMTGYYRKFIKNYAQVATPLTALLRKDTPFNVNRHI